MLFSDLKQLHWIFELYQLGQAGSVQDDANVLFEKILYYILEAFEAETGSLVLNRSDENRAFRIVSGIGLPEGCVGSEIAEGSVVGWVLKNKRVLLLNGNIDDDPRFRDHVPRPDAQVPITSMCWPLISGMRLIGAICVNKFDGVGRYSEADLETGQILANAITLVLDNLMLRADRQMRLRQLAESNERYLESNRQLQIAYGNLEQSEKRLNGILNSLDSVVWSMKPDTYELLYLNKAAKVISGRASEEFLDNPVLWLNIIFPKDRPHVENSLKALMISGDEKLNFRIVHADGTIRWLFHSMRLICDDNGAPLRIDGITVDITQNKQAEDLLKQRNEELQNALCKLQELQQQLLQSEKLSSIGQLAAGVAHEINNPIGYINSNLTSLMSYVKDLLALLALYEDLEIACNDVSRSARIQAFKQQIDLSFLKGDVLDLLDESHEGAERVKKIVQDLKDFSHAGGDSDWQWADLHKCLESTLNIVHNETKYKAAVVKEFGAIPQIWCLPHQLNQVFMNLLVNAAHAIENEGTITIRTGAENDRVWVEVADTGKGIESEHFNKIFDPFFTTKPVGKGTGLGLSVSYNIVKKHHGEITLQSRVGEGSLFRVALPVGGGAPTE